MRFLTGAQHRLPHVLFLRRTLDEGEPDFVETGGHLDARRHHALVELFARHRLVLGRLLMIVFAADRSREHTLSVDGDNELMRGLVALDADQAFGHRLEQSSREHVFAVGRERVTHEHAAAGPERQSLHVLGLRDDGADGVGVGARLGGRIPDSQLRDPQASGQIALEQQRRRGQRGGNVVEPELAAIARQQIANVNGHAEQIAHRVRVLSTVQAMQDVSSRRVLFCGRAIETRDQ